MMMKNLFMMLSALLLACSGSQNTPEARSQMPVKQAEMSAGEWTMLFDGTHTNHWVELGKDKFPKNGWVIEDGALVLSKGGNIITREQYADFELEFEFKLTEGANSGIKYYVSELTNEKTGKTVMNGPEYQIIDDVHNPDIQEREDETVTTAALYLLYEPQGKQLNPAGEWNSGKITSKNGQVEHWLNGTKVVSYQRGSQDYLARKANTKFKDYTRYGEVPAGHIMLTDHNDKVYFRNIRVRSI